MYRFLIESYIKRRTARQVKKHGKVVKKSKFLNDKDKVPLQFLEFQRQ